MQLIDSLGQLLRDWNQDVWHIITTLAREVIADTWLTLIEEVFDVRALLLVGVELECGDLQRVDKIVILVG